MSTYLPQAIQCHRSYTYLHPNYPISLELRLCCFTALNVMHLKKNLYTYTE